MSLLSVMNDIYIVLNSVDFFIVSLFLVRLSNLFLCLRRYTNLPRDISAELPVLYIYILYFSLSLSAVDPQQPHHNSLPPHWRPGVSTAFTKYPFILFRNTAYCASSTPALSQRSNNPQHSTVSSPSSPRTLPLHLAD